MYYVYILTTERNSTLYIGITSNLSRRVYEHKNELIEGFTKKYHVKKLVYYEEHKEVTDAIAREKQLKGWRREKKERLIATQNPLWDEIGCLF